MVVSITADFSGAFKKLKRASKKIDSGAQEAVNEIGELGKNYARSIAPYRTGQVYRNIKLFKGKAYEVKIQALNPIRSYPGEPHQRNIANFNLVRWMHTSPKARGHIKSGDPIFMTTTARYLRAKAGEVARKNIKVNTS